MTITNKSRSDRCSDPNPAEIRSVAAQIRKSWSLGERHFRARRAELLQQQLFTMSRVISKCI
jgi:hypothetical protein